MHKAKWLPEATLKIAEKHIHTHTYTKDKLEKEKYTHLNAEFQTVARRDRKASLSHQCKEIEENRIRCR